MTADSGLYNPIPERVLIALEEVTRFAIDVLFTVDKNYMNVVKLAEVIVGADYTGHVEFGLVSLPSLVQAILEGYINTSAQPHIIRDEGALSLVEGDGAYGVLAVEQALYVACDRASETGAALACARGCICAGPPSWYLSHAADRGLVALAYMNTSPSVAPSRGKKAALGNNCASFSVRGIDEDLFLVDVDFANVSWEEVRRFHSGNFRMPGDWALASDGRPTTNPGAALAGGALLPLGGSEATDGYKGYGLLMLAEIMTGILCGSTNISSPVLQHPHKSVGSWSDSDSESPASPSEMASGGAPGSGAATGGNAYTFIVLDPSKLPVIRREVEHRVSALMQIIRHGQSSETSSSTWAPWDLELENMNRVAHMGGILYRAELVEQLDELADERGVTPMQRLAAAPLQRAVDYLAV